MKYALLGLSELIEERRGDEPSSGNGFAFMGRRWPADRRREMDYYTIVCSRKDDPEALVKKKKKKREPNIQRRRWCCRIPHAVPWAVKTENFLLSNWNTSYTIRGPPGNH